MMHTKEERLRQTATIVKRRLRRAAGWPFGIGGMPIGLLRKWNLSCNCRFCRGMSYRDKGIVKNQWRELVNG